MNKTITIWERYNEQKKCWEHNHISDGYSVHEVVPKPINRHQEKCWSSALWRKRIGELDGITVKESG